VITTWVARPFTVRVEDYVPGREDGWVVLSLEHFTEGINIISRDDMGFELSTENYPLGTLREKSMWLPGTTVVPFIKTRGTVQLWWPGWRLVCFSDDLRVPMGPNDLLRMFQKPSRPDNGKEDENGIAS